MNQSKRNDDIGNLQKHSCKLIFFAEWSALSKRLYDIQGLVDDECTSTCEYERAWIIRANKSTNTTAHE